MVQTTRKCHQAGFVTLHTIIYGKQSSLTTSQKYLAEPRGERTHAILFRHLFLKNTKRTSREISNAHYILLSYGSGGRATKEELYEILNSNGKVIAAQEINYKKNVMSNMRWTNEWINSDGKYNEYLFLLEK